jgi:dipeptidase E
MLLINLKQDKLMKYYLSSFKFGNDIEKLKSMMPANRRIGHINNARDFTDADPERMIENQREELEQLNQLGFTAEVLDLKDYFNKKNELRKKLNTLGSVWVSGGNSFVLRQAMKLSSFDIIIKEVSKGDDFLYAGYSAGICILSESLKSLHLVDKPDDFPYPDINETIWEGLGFFEHCFMPHYDSNHPESEDINRAIKYCIKNRIPYRTLRDGEVIVIE